MAVVVQVMVPADKAGVLFSRNPVTGDPRQIELSANYGLGEVENFKIFLLPKHLPNGFVTDLKFRIFFFVPTERGVSRSRSRQDRSRKTRRR